MVIIIVHELTLSSYTDPLVNRLGMWYCLLKPYFRYGWSSNVFRRSLHILLGNGDSPPNWVYAWHPQRPAILQDTIIFHTDSEYCNQFIPIIHGCDTHIRPFPRCPKTLRKRVSVRGQPLKGAETKSSLILVLPIQIISQERFCTLDFWNSEWYFISLIG